ncbi:hypothetical protein BGZ95_000199 [Linnemannia exigua]|uniref:RRM domain-containing protein n=1 Tax=Linnemannia exigua TaxID=604196 RepID=A0AAD4H9Y0_9FUNG|nr:hypothetical protein BGZ95_000199 [Linnemannia exigua]
MTGRQKTLYISGFSQRSRARDLAYEFERFGPLVRCDIPALRSSSSRPYAFVEFKNDRDARDAYNEMRDARFEGYRLSVQFAKNTPNASWRYERGGGRDRSRSPSSRRGRSPPRRRSSPRRRSRSPRERGGERGGDRDRSGSPRGGGDRDRQREDRKARSPARGSGGGGSGAEDRRRSSGSRSPARSADRNNGDISNGDSGRGSGKRDDDSPEDVVGSRRGRGSRSATPERAAQGDDEARSRSGSPRPRSISPRARSVTP